MAAAVGTAERPERSRRIRRKGSLPSRCGLLLWPLALCADDRLILRRRCRSLKSVKRLDELAVAAKGLMCGGPQNNGGRYLATWRRADGKRRALQ
jgi:hypothetical protein